MKLVAGESLRCKLRLESGDDFLGGHPTIERLEEELLLFLEAEVLERERVFDDPAAATLKGLLFHF
jgi:hypothetical protein